MGGAPLTLRTWLAEAQDSAQAVGRDAAVLEQQQDSGYAYGYGGWHAEEAAYQQTEGLQLAHFLYPNIVPRLWSPILHLAPYTDSSSGKGPGSDSFEFFILL